MIMGDYSSWVFWPTVALVKEMQDRMRYFCSLTDGTMNFPNSGEGDLLKVVFVPLSKLEAANSPSGKE